MKLEVNVIPGSKVNQIVTFEKNVLKIKITAKAQDNRANQALVKYLSGVLDIPKSSVIIIRGQTGRRKLLEIPDGLDLAKLISNYESGQ